MDYDKTAIPDTYAASRKLPEATVRQWMDAIAAFLAPVAGGRHLAILDLGCGTGRFAVPLAERFAATVVGVEPSEKMRRQAATNASHPRVTYLEGCAEAIPCGDASFDAALLSMVVHHFRSVPDALRELRRVLKPGAFVFIRSDLEECRGGVRFYEFFPAAEALARERAPGIAALTAQFEAAGFTRVHCGTITQQIDPDLKAHYERIKLRGLSTLAAISDEEFRAGLDAMRRAAERPRSRAADSAPQLMGSYGPRP